MTDSKGGVQSDPTYTAWRCPKCSAFMRTAMPCFEVSHPCPKNLRNPVYMQGVTQ